MVFSAPRRLRCLFACFILASFLGAYGGPIDVPQGKGLIARQATSTTTSVETSTTRTRSRTSASSTFTSTAVTTTSTSTTSSSSTTSASSSSTTSVTSTSSHSSTSSSTSTSTTTSASATATSSSSSILSKSSPYFGYAVGVLVVVSLFGLLLVVLIIRFIVQKFSKKPEPQPTPSKAGQWRYSQDTELYSPGAVRNNSVNVAALGTRHKDVGSEMGEREAFLSTESVALYPPAKEQDRYTDDDATIRRHSRSLSNASQSTATPYVSRRPNSMSFLHSPPATHPAFVVHHGSQSGHSHSDEHALRAVPEAPQETNEAGSGPRSLPSLLVARASHSDPYRQQTLASSAMVSRAASTASAYSQPSAIRSGTPPLPVLLSAFAQPQPQVSPDVSAALSTMQAQNPSMDTIYTDESTPPRTSEGRSGEQLSTLRQTPGRMGWGGQAPTSIHSHADLFFDHSHSR